MGPVAIMRRAPRAQTHAQLRCKETYSASTVTMCHIAFGGRADGLHAHVLGITRVRLARPLRSQNRKVNAVRYAFSLAPSLLARLSPVWRTNTFFPLRQKDIPPR